MITFSQFEGVGVKGDMAPRVFDSLHRTNLEFPILTGGDARLQIKIMQDEEFFVAHKKTTVSNPSCALALIFRQQIAIVSDPRGGRISYFPRTV